ncbi:unnamed protein product [Prorocentrum cordatum]|uniref:Fe2OG dioxygenase domain-containing protein n=1 Tax=Prorocentrum cordatum TaxID=2364126 RepID=A0ABN9T9C1_9DINO|nr:unnamed protein product [Polarella glacialis]
MPGSLLAATLRAALAACFLVARHAAGGPAPDRLVVLNAAAEELGLEWLRAGPGDEGDAVDLGNIPAGSAGEPSAHTLDTAAGHAFRVGGSGGPMAVHLGDLNVLAVGRGASGGLDVELLGPQQLEPVAAGTRGARSPRLGVSLASVLDKLSERWPPQGAGPPPAVARGGGALPDEALVVVVPAGAGRLELRRLPPGLPSEGASGGELWDSSSLVAALEAAAGEAAATAVVSARKGEVFYLASGASSASQTFLYPGELALVAAAWAGGRLEAELLGEDDLKIFLSDVAARCAEDEGVPRGPEAQAAAWQGYECLRDRARLPRTGVLLPEHEGRALLGKLWSSWDHWLLCSYQRASEPLRSIDINVTSFEGGGPEVLRAQVLREDPLVLAVRDFVGAGVCGELSAEAGTNQLEQATVGGSGSTQLSRSRRTLTANLWPDLEDPDSALTRVALRFFEFARAAVGLAAGAEGQEPVNWLFYKPGYEYRPHCDGPCGTRHVKTGKRVASSLLYCAAADEGGGTVFPRDRLKFEPSPGSFLLFSYNPDPRSLSTHAACPVLRGQKTTATQWYREGVSAEVNWDVHENWGSFPRPKSRKRAGTTRKEL